LIDLLHKQTFDAATLVQLERFHPWKISVDWRDFSVVLQVSCLRLTEGYSYAFYSIDFPSFGHNCLTEGADFFDSQIVTDSRIIHLYRRRKSPDLFPLLCSASMGLSALLLHMFDRTLLETMDPMVAQAILFRDPLPYLPVTTLHRPSHFEEEKESNQSLQVKADKERLREGYGIHSADRGNS
jgi:hypothetical protein